MKMKPICNLHGIRKDFPNGGSIGPGPVSSDPLDLFVLPQPGLARVAVTTIKNRDWFVCGFINNHSSAGTVYLENCRDAVVSGCTVRNYKRIGVDDRTAAVTVAIQRGMLPPP